MIGVILKIPYQIYIRLYNRKVDFLVILLLFCGYLVIYRNVIFSPYLINGVDFQVPGSTTQVTWLGFVSPWSESSNGFSFGPNWSIYGALLNGLFIVVSAGNAIFAQKIMFSGVFFASIFMYFFIAKHITNKPIVAIHWRHYLCIWIFHSKLRNWYSVGICFLSDSCLFFI